MGAHAVCGRKVELFLDQFLEFGAAVGLDCVRHGLISARNALVGLDSVKVVLELVSYEVSGVGSRLAVDGIPHIRKLFRDQLAVGSHLEDVILGLVFVGPKEVVGDLVSLDLELVEGVAKAGPLHARGVGLVLHKLEVLALLVEEAIVVVGDGDDGHGEDDSDDHDDDHEHEEHAERDSNFVFPKHLGVLPLLKTKREDNKKSVFFVFVVVVVDLLILGFFPLYEHAHTYTWEKNGFISVIL